MIFEDVGIYGELWLAVKLRFKAIGMVEREKLIFNYAYFSLNVGILFKKLFMFGTGREEAQAEETSDRHQA